MKGYGGLLTVAAAGLLLVGNAVSAAANDFYAGKTIRFIVGYAPWRLRYLYPRHRPAYWETHSRKPHRSGRQHGGSGKPLGANYMYNKAEADGLTVGRFQELHGDAASARRKRDPV